MRYFKLGVLLVLLLSVALVGYNKNAQAEGISNVKQGTEKYTDIFEASKNGNLALVKTLISKDININAFDENGSTALQLASGNGHLDIVKYLVENGVDVKVKDNQGKTAID